MQLIASFPPTSALPPATKNKKAHSSLPDLDADALGFHAYLSILHILLLPFVYPLSNIVDQLTSDPLQWRSFHSTFSIVALTHARLVLALFLFRWTNALSMHETAQEM